MNNSRGRTPGESTVGANFLAGFSRLTYACFHLKATGRAIGAIAGTLMPQQMSISITKQVLEADPAGSLMHRRID